MQGLGPIAATVERLGQLIDLEPGAAEDEGGRGRLDVEDAAQRGRLVSPRDDVCTLLNRRRGARRGPRATDLDADRIAQVAVGDGVDAGRHRRREENGLPIGWRRFEDRFDVVGEPHVEHLVGLVEHDDGDVVEWQRPPADVVECPARRRHDDVHAATQRVQLAADRLTSVDRDDSRL